MVFTALWFFRHLDHGKRTADSDLRPSRAAIEPTIRAGLRASGPGIAFSMILLFILRTSPQTGIMIAPGPGGDPVQWIAAIDAISLTSLLIIPAEALVVQGFSVRFPFRTTNASAAAGAAAAV